MKTTELLTERINEIGRGRVFRYSDLNISPGNRAAVAMSLSRMVADKKLKKIGKGKFYMPLYSKLGEVFPQLNDITKDLLYKNDKIIGYISGIPAFAQLGLTTQISSNIIIATRKYRRPLTRGNYKIYYITQENEITYENISILRFLDALRFIKKIPGCTPDQAVKILLKKLNTFSKKEITLLKKYALSYSASVRALLGAMLEVKYYPSEDLFSSLNPLTSYKFAISSQTLPNKSKWNIK